MIRFFNLCLLYHQSIPILMGTDILSRETTLSKLFRSLLRKKFYCKRKEFTHFRANSFQRGADSFLLK